jgi:hypothetical protein
MYYAKKKPKAPRQAPVVTPPPIPVQDVAVTDTSGKKAEALRRRAGGVASTALTETLGG